VPAISRRALLAGLAALPLAACAPLEIAPAPKVASGGAVDGQLTVLQVRDFDPRHIENLKRTVERFAGARGWAVEVGEMHPLASAEQVAASVASGNPPDLLIGAWDALTLWHLGALQPLDDVVRWAEGQHGQAVPGLKQADNFAGKWWAAPFFTRSGGWWARKSWFDEIGLDVAKAHDFGEWRTACLNVSDPARQRWGWGATVTRSGDGEGVVMDVLLQSGGRFTDETGTNVVFDSPDTVAAFEWLRDTFTDRAFAPMLPRDVRGWNDEANNRAWVAGQIGFTLNAGTLLAQALGEHPAVGEDTFLVPQPIGAVGAKQQVARGAGGASLYLVAGARNPDAAKLTMQHLLAKQTQRELWAATPGYAMPAYAWGWDEPEIARSVNGVGKVFKERVYEQSHPVWKPGPGPKLWINAVASSVVLTDTIGSILRSNTPPKNAVRSAQARIVALRDKFGGN
jgi:multiple sugar transport system substrate-binding protein